MVGLVEFDLVRDTAPADYGGVSVATLGFVLTHPNYTLMLAVIVLFLWGGEGARVPAYAKFLSSDSEYDFSPVCPTGGIMGICEEPDPPLGPDRSS